MTIAPTRQHADVSEPSFDLPHRRFVRATLSVAGTVAVAIGGALLILPRSFIDIDGEPTVDLLSETRSPGTPLLVVGVWFLVAAVRKYQMGAAALAAAVVFLGYGAGRMVSIVIDGQPSGPLIGAFIVELAVGLAALAAAVLLRSEGNRVDF